MSFWCLLANCHLHNSHHLKIFRKDPCLVPPTRTVCKSLYGTHPCWLKSTHLPIVQAEGVPSKRTPVGPAEVWLASATVGDHYLGLAGSPAQVSPNCAESKQQFDFPTETNAPFLVQDATVPCGKVSLLVRRFHRNNDGIFMTSVTKQSSFHYFRRTWDSFLLKYGLYSIKLQDYTILGRHLSILTYYSIFCREIYLHLIRIFYFL